MKLTLEKADLLQLLSMALNYELREDEVEVKAEPFEVHLKTVRLLDLARANKPAPVAVQDKTRTTVARPGAPATEQATPEDLDDLLSQSANLAGAGLPSADIDPDVKGMNDFARALRPGETEEPPGEDFSGEIPG